MVQEKRFKGMIGSDYDSIKLAWPYYDKLRNLMGQAITQYCQKISQTEINALEVGYGTGDGTAIVLEANKKIKLLAVDNEELMFKKARERLRSYILEGRLSLYTEDALSYLKKSNSNSFNVFSSTFVLHNLGKQERYELLKDIFRVLKEGGLFIAADKYVADNKKKDEELYEKQIKRLKIFDKLGKTYLKKQLIEHEMKDRSPEYIMVEGESRKEMEKIGFRKIQTIKRIKREALISAEKPISS